MRVVKSSSSRMLPQKQFNVDSHLMIQEREVRNSLMNSVGFAAGLEGEKKEDQLRSGHQADVLPFEFAEFTEELVAKVLNPRPEVSRM